MDSLFDRNIEAKDPKYVFLRDNKDRPEELAYYRDLLESYWQIFSPYADSNFKQEIAIDFDARFWEMYLVCTLISLTIPVSKRKTKGGPDICICTERNRIFIEAISPDKGSISNPDQVPEMIFGKATQVPDAEITNSSPSDFAVSYASLLSGLSVSCVTPYLSRRLTKMTPPRSLT